MPAAGLIAVAVAAAAQGGSVDASDWLGYAVFAALLLASAVGSGAALRASRPAIAAAIALVGLAGWTALSLRWSPVPSLARDEALLVGLYAIVLILPALTLRTGSERIVAVALVPLACAGVAVATAVRLAAGADPAGLYSFGRLFSPITYWNAQAAFFLVGLWPALALAARRTVPVIARAALVGAAAALLCGWLLVQSKGGGLGLVVSAVVVFALTRGRVRLLVPTLLVAALTAPAFGRLTGPYPARLHGRAALDAAIHGAGRALLVVTVVALAVGLVYALIDRRLRPSVRAVRVAGAVALAGLVCGLALGTAAFLHHVHGHPVAWAQQQWRHFDTRQTGVRAGSHFASISPGRRDFWRVAWADFRSHPATGIGGRGFGPSYLEHGRTDQTPIRAHSLELDTLSETGAVGFVLLLLALGIPLVCLVRRARHSAFAAALAAAAVYWLVHASVDWIWTFPSDGILFFALLGVGLSGPAARPLRARAAVPLGIAATVVAALAFAPPWLAARYADRALAGRSANPSHDLRLASRLDPLSTDPYVTQSLLATRPAGAIPPLLRAIRMEPRAVDLRYLLGRAELVARRPRAAVRQLVVARRLDPRDPLIRAALRRAVSDARGRVP